MSSYRLIEDGNGWFIVQYYSGVDGKWKEYKNYYNFLEGAKDEVWDLKNRMKKNELTKVVKRVIEEF